MQDAAFIPDVDKIRVRARQSIQKGAVTSGYAADREAVIDMLNGALATELVCALRYRHHYYMANGIRARDVAREFLEHANEEQQHADMLAARIVQLGGDPDCSPTGLADRSHADYGPVDTSLHEMVKQDLVAERIAIDSYREMIAFVDNDDPTTRRALEEILAVEEEHAEELAGWLGGFR